MKNKFFKKSLTYGLLAFIIYGLWSFYANKNYGTLVAIRSGIAQGIMSLFITTIMTFGMEKVHSKVKWRMPQFIITAFGPLFIVLGAVVLIHSLIHTPNIFKTILPSAIIGTIYCIIYTIGLSMPGKLQKKNKFLLVVILATFLLIVGGTYYTIQEKMHTQTHGIIYVHGLHGPVFIKRDEYGVPHIRALKSDDDAFFALGFVHAQDRLWQMEFQKHVAAGTLSEIFGKKTIPQDKFLRTWGFYRAAKLAWASLNAHSKEIVRSYTAGVNAEINSGKIPLQILILDYKPSSWSFYDSIAWQKMMAWQLQNSWQQKIKNYIITNSMNNHNISYYMPPYPASAPTVLSYEDLNTLILKKNIPVAENGKSIQLMASMQQLSKSAEIIENELGPLNFPGKGSNAWVVSGRFTQSKMPLLANDIHLQLTAPALWYLAEIKGPNLHVTGSTIPGLPAIIVGHNNSIAWGITNGYNDAEDLFILSPHEKTQTLNEVIKVKGEPSINFPVQISSHGPVISQITPNMNTLPQMVAIQWPALESGDTTVQSFLDIQYASNWNEFISALKYFVTPTQNFVYADTKGNIGYYYPGKLPIRNGFSGALPVPSSYSWDGYIPFKQLPHAYNPPEGFIATANNAVTPPNSYPYSLTFNWPVPPYRVERIRDLLKDNGLFNTKKFMAFQADTISYMWQDFKPALLLTKPLDKKSTDALKVLKQWDGDCSMNSKAATIFAYWLSQINGLWPKQLAFGSKWAPALYMKERINDPKMKPFLSKSLALAVKELAAKKGENSANWAWGNTHEAVFNELGLGKSRLVGSIWRKSIATPGGSYTLDVGTYDPANFSQFAGASYREVIDLNNLHKSYYMIPLGQSESIFSKFYSNLLRLWRDGKYILIPKDMITPCNPAEANCLELLPLK